MEKLIGREKEIKTLMEAYQGDEPQFLAVYGRRRVGKTFLIKRFDAFQLLKSAIEQSHQEKKVIFFDELPWIDTPKSGFLSALEHFWNSWAAFRSDLSIKTSFCAHRHQLRPIFGKNA